MAIMAPSSSQTTVKLNFHLSDPGFTNLHRAGLAGLYMSLKALEPLTDKPNGLRWELTPHSVSLFWNCSDKEAIAWLLQNSFRIDSDGLIDFAALQPCRGLNLTNGSKLVIHDGILGTFLQHGQTRKLSEKKSIVLSLEDQEIQQDFKPISSYGHQTAVGSLCNEKGILNTKPWKVAGWLCPGAAVRHRAFEETKIQESATNCLVLLFAPIACHYFQLRSVLRDRRAQFSLIIPEISDLEYYWQARTNMAVFDWKNSFANSAGDAALHWMTYTQTDDIFRKFKVVHCQVHIFGTLAWSAKQKSRSQVFNVTISEKISKQYRVIMQHLGNRSKTSKKGETWIDVSFARELFAQNLILNRPWYQGFSELAISKERFGKLGFEREGLYKMLNESSLWDRESEHQFVVTCHEALRRRYGQLGERARREGISFETLFQRQNEKLRTSIQRCKNVQSMREFLTDFWSRAGSLPTLREHWQDIWPLLDSKNWRTAKDLALLALASYKRSETDVAEQEVEEVLI